jgi:hypothetical protein
MAVIRQRWGWRTWCWVASLTILAVLAGVGSELMAGNVTQFSFHGNELVAMWNLGTATTSTSASVDASQGVTGPGKPVPTTSAWVSADVLNLTTNQETTFSAFNPLGPNDVLNVDASLNSGNTSVTAPGTLNFWNWNAGTVNSVAATAFVNASLENPQYTEKSASNWRQYDRVSGSGTDTRMRSTGTSAWYPTGSGGFNIVDAAGNNYQIVAPNTSVTAAVLLNNKSGNRTVSQ